MTKLYLSSKKMTWPLQSLHPFHNLCLQPEVPFLSSTTLLRWRRRSTAGPGASPPDPAYAGKPCPATKWMNEWMNECLTTPQHKKQIGYWVSEKGKRKKLSSNKWKTGTSYLAIHSTHFNYEMASDTRLRIKMLLPWMAVACYTPDVDY